MKNVIFFTIFLYTLLSYSQAGINKVKPNTLPYILSTTPPEIIDDVLTPRILQFANIDFDIDQYSMLNVLDGSLHFEKDFY